MKWNVFKNELNKRGIFLFSSLDVERFFKKSGVATRFFLHRLHKQGEIEIVKRGLYKIKDQYIPDFYLANKIYEPSYISLETALSYHRIIPETVYEIMSVSSKGTRVFQRDKRVYSYRKIRKSAFTGYSIEKENNCSFWIADPEKAFVDSTYFRSLDGLEPLSRFHKEKINYEKAVEYAKLLNKKTVEIIKQILQ